MASSVAVEKDSTATSVAGTGSSVAVEKDGKPAESTNSGAAPPVSEESVNKTNAAPSSATQPENEGTVSPSVAVEKDGKPAEESSAASPVLEKGVNKPMRHQVWLSRRMVNQQKQKVVLHRQCQKKAQTRLMQPSSIQNLKMKERCHQVWLSRRMVIYQQDRASNGAAPPVSEEGTNKTNTAPSSATKLESEGPLSPSVAVEKDGKPAESVSSAAPPVSEEGTNKTNTAPHQPQNLKMKERCHQAWLSRRW